MSSLSLTIDSHPVTVDEGQTVLAAARKLGLDIPTLCYLEKCGPLSSCQACLVKINGKLVPSCSTLARDGMVVESETNEVHAARRTALELLFSDHVGDCLAPCNRLCPLGLNVPMMLRHIQAGELPAAASLVRLTLPLPGVLGRLCHHPCEQGCRRGSWDQPAAIREVERFAAACQEEKSGAQSPKSEATSNGKSVAVVGAGPAGLAAAHWLARHGIRCALFHRSSGAGGSLRKVEANALPAEVLETEILQLKHLGVEFKPGFTLENRAALLELLGQYSAVLLALGELSKERGETLGLTMAPGGIQIDAVSFQTSQPGVFAIGRATKPAAQLVRVLAEAQTAAQAIQQSLSGQPAQKPVKLFSSAMGRLNKDELTLMAKPVAPHGKVTPCDICAGFNRQEATSEASRCLHCDCRSTGSCSLQYYGQLYAVNPNRHRLQRRTFEQYARPGGVIFEPGKCIRCGICIRLTELACEPLGLSFVGRGFDVKVAAPFHEPFQEGLRLIALECAQACPTGAIVVESVSPARPGA